MMYVWTPVEEAQTMTLIELVGTTRAPSSFSGSVSSLKGAMSVIFAFMETNCMGDKFCTPAIVVRSLVVSLTYNSKFLHTELLLFSHSSQHLHFQTYSLMFGKCQTVVSVCMKKSKLLASLCHRAGAHSQNMFCLLPCTYWIHCGHSNEYHLQNKK